MLRRWSMALALIAGLTACATVSMQCAQKILKYDLNGQLQHAWGTFGVYLGHLWGVHQMSVDSEGNLYVAEVFNGRPQKFRPRPGANPATLLKPLVHSLTC